MTLAHEQFSGYFGVTKTNSKLLRYFFWHNFHQEVEEFVKTWEVFQMMRGGEKKVKARLKFVPLIKEVFSKEIVGVCGPLTTSSGGKISYHGHLISLLYLDDIPVPNIPSDTVVKAVILDFSRMDFPRGIQCDLGTSFTSNLTTKFYERFNINSS